MKNEWQKVERITNQHVGWECSALGEISNGIVTGVGRDKFLWKPDDCEEKSSFSGDWYVRPPEPPRKKTVEIYLEKLRSKYGSVGASPAQGDLNLIWEILDEEFERREK